MASALPASPPLTPTKRKATSPESYFSPPTSAMASSSIFSPNPTPGPEKLPALPQGLVLPPLPKISDTALERLAFTHSSYHGRQKDRHGLDLTVEHTDNEKLEHVGDSLLGCIVTLLLHQLYPNLGDGTATVLKAHLVSNTTLAQISSRYGLQKRFIASPASMFSISTGEKSRANLFEAYIAALYSSLIKESQRRIPTPPLTPLHDTDSTSSEATRVPPMDDGTAFITISTWLRGVFTPIATWAFEEMKAQRKVKHRTRSSGQDGEQDEDDDESMDEKAMGRTAQLNEYFTKYEGKLPLYDYNADPTSGMWKCVCIATRRDGTRLTGSATRGSKKVAAQVAAWKVCSQMGWE